MSSQHELRSTTVRKEQGLIQNENLHQILSGYQRLYHSLLLLVYEYLHT